MSWNSRQCEDYNFTNFGIKYPFGKGVKLHAISDFIILEYLDRAVEGCTVTVFLTDKVQFHLVGASISYPTLDSAIAGALAYKYCGANSQSGSLYVKMCDGMVVTCQDWDNITKYKGGEAASAKEKLREPLVKLSTALKAALDGLRILCDAANQDPGPKYKQGMRILVKYQPMYVIRNSSCVLEDEDSLYWNYETGYGDRESATEFDHFAYANMDLPIEGEWEVVR
jgi:hypothetical protein